MMDNHDIGDDMTDDCAGLTVADGEPVCLICGRPPDAHGCEVELAAEIMIEVTGGGAD